MQVLCDALSMIREPNDRVWGCCAVQTFVSPTYSFHGRTESKAACFAMHLRTSCLSSSG